MSFPHSEMEPSEKILLDTNPTFGRLVWPLLELMVITGVVWLLIGLIDSSAMVGSGMQPVRNFLLIGWVVLILWRVVPPGLAWLGERFVLTDRRILLRRGLFRPRVTTVDLRSVRSVDRKGSALYLRTHYFGPALEVADVPSARKVAKMVARLT
nr:PH domain-containing protein [Corynebacterium lactis]